MLVLFETPAGFALFKVLDEGKLDKVEDLWKEFETGELARKIVKLKAFSKFENTAEALGAATLLVDSKPSKGLRKFLKAECQGELLAVADSKLGSTIKEKLKIDCIHNNGVMEMMRGLRSQLSELITGLAEQDIGPMSLGLSHSLSRYKLKFSPDKVDTMIIQAIGLLDDLDKELNTYAMRVREWYGWHFPELGKIIQDNILYAKVVKMMGHRTNAVKLDFSETFLTEDVEGELKEAAIISMGTEISDQDMANIKALCDQVIALSEYRAQLSEYLRNRMNAIAPNLTVLVGELVGARLIAHAGSLINLAKQPASTVQILGAEKALFRALKTKHQTPKYGLIFNASLVGQAAPKLKGKISRSLAAKSSISVRYDALGDAPDASIGFECRAKLETRLRQLEGRTLGKLSGTAKGKTKIEPYDPNRKQGAPGLVTAAKTYNPAADIAIGTAETPDKTGKEIESKKKKKKKHQQQLAEDMIEPKEEPDAELIEEPVAKEVSEDEHAEDKTGKELESKKKKKKKRQHQLAEEMIEPKEEPDAELIEEPVAKKVSEEEHAEERTTKKKKTKHRESELKFEELEILETGMDGTEELALKKKKKKKEKRKATMEALQVFEKEERSVGLLKQAEGADIEVQVKRIKKKRKLESEEDPGETPGTSEKKKKKKKVKKEPEDVL